MRETLCCMRDLPNMIGRKGVWLSITLVGIFLAMLSTADVVCVFRSSFLLVGHINP